MRGTRCEAGRLLRRGRVTRFRRSGFGVCGLESPWRPRRVARPPQPSRSLLHSPSGSVQSKIAPSPFSGLFTHTHEYLFWLFTKGLYEVGTGSVKLIAMRVRIKSDTQYHSRKLECSLDSNHSFRTCLPFLRKSPCSELVTARYLFRLSFSSCGVSW